MAALLFAYGTYVALLLCLVFCGREAWKGGWVHGLIQFLILIAFIFLFWLLESWAGVRAPFYDYDPVYASFPHLWERFDFSSLGASFPSLFGPGPSATHPCALVLHDKMPACIPIAGGCIVFSLYWTVRLLYESKEFATEPFKPVTAPFIICLMALWLDLPLDPILALSQNCTLPIETVHPGLQFWTWSTNATLADFWFHIPAYNFGTWYAAPGILTAVVIWLYWMYRFVMGYTVQNADGAIRSVIMLLMFLVFFVSPNAANSPLVIYTIVLLFGLFSILTLANKWESFKRNNEWRPTLILTLAFFFLFPIGAFLLSGDFSLARHFYLLLVALVVAGFGIFFAIAPYWQAPTPVVPILPVLLGIVTLVAVLGYLGNI